MSSGIVADPTLSAMWTGWKQNKTDDQHLQCTIEEGTVKVTKTITKAECEGLSFEEKHNKALDLLDEQVPCFVLLNFEFTNDLGDQNKIVFVKWIPDLAPMKKKMLYASTVEGFKGGIPGFAKEVQGADMDDVAYDEIKKNF